MLRVNIFFMLFEKLFVRDKRVIVVDAIDFLFSLSFPSVLKQINFFGYLWMKRKLIYSMDQLTQNCH